LAFWTPFLVILLVLSFLARVHRSGCILDPTIQACTDHGFQGLKIGKMKTITPKKNTKYRKLSDSDKEQNRAISSVRVSVEHVIAGVKINRSVQDV